VNHPYLAERNDETCTRMCVRMIRAYCDHLCPYTVVPVASRHAVLVALRQIGLSKVSS
jgi:hypothetical protein